MSGTIAESMSYEVGEGVKKKVQQLLIIKALARHCVTLSLR